MHRAARISTRGSYDLGTGRRVAGRPGSYRAYPAGAVRALYGSDEVAVVVHGLRNDPAAALAKFAMAKRRLRQLGYRHPVIGFTYDSNTRGAHLKQTQLRALRAGQRIAESNGASLAAFVSDFRKNSPGTRIRLLGHSLGAQVIASAVRRMSRARANRGAIHAVYFFGASIPSDSPRPSRYGRAFESVVRTKVLNCYCPTDAVLLEADADGSAPHPLGLAGAAGRPVSKYRQRMLRTPNHRFASYAASLRSFP